MTGWSLQKQLFVTNLLPDFRIPLAYQQGGLSEHSCDPLHSPTNRSKRPSGVPLLPLEQLRVICLAYVHLFCWRCKRAWWGRSRAWRFASNSLNTDWSLSINHVIGGQKTSGSSHSSGRCFCILFLSATFLPCWSVVRALVQECSSVFKPNQPSCTSCNNLV